MTATDKLNWINERLNEGRTLFFATAIRIVKVAPKHAKQWENAGFPYFKIEDGNLRMISRTNKGRPVYEIVDGCQITAR